MILSTALIAIIVFLCLNYFKKRNEFNKKLSHIGGVKPLWFFGNALDFPSLSHMISTLTMYNNMFGGVAKMSFGLGKYILTVSKYSYIEALLTSPKILGRSREYTFLKPWLGEGLLTSTGKKWQERRKLLTPAFHFEVLKPIVEILNDATHIFVQKLKKLDEQPFDVYPLVTLCTLDIISESAMGTKVYAQEQEDSEYVDAVETMAKIIIRRILSAWKQYDFLFYFSNDYRKQVKALKVLHSTTDKVIKQRREQLCSTGFTQNADEFGKKKKLAFLDLLLTAEINGQPLSDQDIREEVDTFMFEGHDTTSSGVSFALYNLGKYPEFQKKVYEEQQKLFGNDINRPMTFEDLQNMKYLEMFIKESLRLYPPVSFFGRLLTEDIEIDGHILPTGLHIQLFPYIALRNKDYFSDPETFNPERFSPENRDNIKPLAYIPFGVGSRNCIGQKFAMMEIKAVLSKVIRNFEILPVENFEPVVYQELVLKSANGAYIKLKNKN